jgi:hypothetical protein
MITVHPMYVNLNSICLRIYNICLINECIVAYKSVFLNGISEASDGERVTRAAADPLNLRIPAPRLEVRPLALRYFLYFHQCEHLQRGVNRLNTVPI